MSSLIAKQPRDPKKQTTVSLSNTVLSDLELYCQFIDSARDWVVNEALKTVFHRDKAFLEWKERGGSAASSALPAQGRQPVESESKLERPKVHRAPTPAVPAVSSAA